MRSSNRRDEAWAIRYMQEHPELPMPPGLRVVPQESRPSTPAPRLTDGYRSKLERFYAQRLDAEQHAGVVLHWEYEPFSLRLGHDCFYMPDFLVIYRAQPTLIELHETKGHWREKARVKIKAAAKQHYYFRFQAVQYNRGEWIYEPIPAKAGRI